MWDILFRNYEYFKRLREARLQYGTLADPVRQREEPMELKLDENVLMIFSMYLSLIGITILSFCWEWRNKIWQRFKLVVMYVNAS